MLEPTVKTLLSNYLNLLVESYVDFTNRVKAGPDKSTKLSFSLRLTAKTIS